MSQGFLDIVEGNAAGQRIPLDGHFVVGRDEKDAGALGSDPEISRRHARFSALDSGQFIVEDLGSTNGTMVNGQKITSPHILRPGDRISVGRTHLEFKEVSVAESRSTMVVPGPAVGSAGAAGTSARSAPAASTPSPPAAPSGYGSVPTTEGARVSGGGAPRKSVAAVAALVLLAGGAGIGYAVHGSSKSSSSASNSSSSSSSRTTLAVGVRDATGHPDASGFKCSPDKNGNAGPGHFRFITSGCEDAKSLIAQFPLQQGTSGGKKVYYVVTDSSDQSDALTRKVNFSTKLANGKGTSAVMKVTEKNGVINFPATVTFGKKRVLQAGPTGFPPAAAQPSAVGDATYSPLIELPDGTVINAPQIANDSGQAEKVLNLDKANKTVLYQETEGRYEDKHVHYASFESGSPVAATIEDVTYAPALNKLPAAGKDGLKNSSREELVAFVNGATGITNPGRQGENSVILDNADPHNILKEVPVLPLHESVGDPAYTPGWDVHFAEWTPAAIAGGVRVELQSTDEVAMWVTMKMVTGPGGTAFGPSGFVVNCPLISIDIP
jgi:hypothetical protein